MENKINQKQSNKKENGVTPTEEEEQKIFSKFNEYLNSLNDNKCNIKEISDYFCRIYNSYKNYFFQIFLILIIENVEKTQKIEYLYLTIEIIKLLHSNRNNNNISEEELSYLLSCLKDICRNYHYSMNDNFNKNVKDSLNHLKECKIYDDMDINNIIMELRINSDPKITGSENDRNCLSNLFNDKLLKIDNDMVNLYKDILAVNRGNINILRMNLIKKYNEMIEKQTQLYNKNIGQIKDINEMIDKMDKNFPGIK